MAAAPLLDAAPSPQVSSSSALRPVRRGPVKATGEVEDAPSSVLVVEPDERTRSLLQAGLGAEGFHVIAAGSAEEAQRYLSADRPLPGMVFCEAALRGADGFTFCGQLRADQRTCDLPVVLLSRSPESFHRELAGGAGADQYLPKPLYLNDVVALARLMAGRSSSAARFEADTQVLPLVQALRALLTGVRSGRVELAAGGFIIFREGQVVDASFDGLRGEDALHQVLLLGRGEFVVTFGPALTRATMSFSLADLCSRSLPRLRRWEALLQRCLPLDAVLEVQFSRLAELLGELPDEVSCVVRLCDGERPVRAVVLESNLEPTVALEVVTRLYALGVVEPKDPSAPAPIAPRPFFEPTGPTVALDPEVARQLEAFQLRPVVEAREQKPTPVPVIYFVKRPLELRPGPTELERELEEQLALPTPKAGVPVEVDDAVDADVTQVPRPRRWGWLLALGAVLGSVAAVAGYFGAAALWPVAPPPPEPDPVAAPAEVVVSAQPAPPPVLAVAPAAPAWPFEEAAGEPAPEPVSPASEQVAEAATAEVPEPLVEAISLYESGRYREASALLDELTGADPSLARAWLFLGLARFDGLELEQAEAAAMKALALEPQNGRALMLLASIYLTQGKSQAAQVELQQYLKLHPRGPFAREARQLLAQ